jgi:hypothetical protein
MVKISASEAEIIITCLLIDEEGNKQNRKRQGKWGYIIFARKEWILESVTH